MFVWKTHFFPAQHPPQTTVKGDIVVVQKAFSMFAKYVRPCFRAPQKSSDKAGRGFFSNNKREKCALMVMIFE